MNSGQHLAMTLSGFPEVSFILGIEPELGRVSEQTGLPQIHESKPRAFIPLRAFQQELTVP